MQAKRQSFRKYGEIARMYLKMQLAWRADVIFNMLFTISRILFAYLLWGIIFAENDIVAGFSFHGMLSYYIVSSFLSQIEMSRGISEEIFWRIREGSFSNFIVLPVSTEGYYTAMEAGTVLFYLGFDLLAAVIWIFLFRIQFVFTTDPVVLACALLMVFLGLLFMVQFNYYLGILTLKYQEISTFLRIKNNLAALITGTIVPLSLFPDVLVRLMRYLPFYYVTYLPSMLFVGQCRTEALRGIFVLLFWCIAFQLLIRFTWERYRKKYDGAGI